MELLDRVKSLDRSHVRPDEWKAAGEGRPLSTDLKRRIVQDVNRLSDIDETSRKRLITFLTADKSARKKEFGSYKGLSRTDAFQPAAAPALGLRVDHYGIIDDVIRHLQHQPNLTKELVALVDGKDIGAASAQLQVFKAGEFDRKLKDCGFTGKPVGRILAQSLATKPFVILTGNSGTGKTKLGELFAKWLLRDNSDAHVLIAVGADWTDNRNVVGFVNYLRQTNSESDVRLPIYQSTPVLDLILHATGSPLPHFLILDEMNLSHVERYFADFLSAMETSDGEVILHTEQSSLPRSAAGPADVPSKLKLPNNLFVIGTVNVDETTYMFSPKVLDRANVIEFRVAQGDVDGFLASGGGGIGSIEEAPAGYAQAFLDLAKRARQRPRADLELLRNEEPPNNAKDKVKEIHRVLKDIFALLQSTHREFAYRTIAEVLRYAAVDFELTEKRDGWNWQACMDAQILQKILPKLHGNKRQLETVLIQLAMYCETGRPVPADAKTLDGLSRLPVVRKTDPFFADSYRKLCDMLDSVRRDQFVSFIQ